MEILTTIFLCVSLISIVLFLVIKIYPNISRNLKLKIILAVLVLELGFIYFTSNSYRHWKFFDDNNLKIICRQLPPIIADDDNFYYTYIAYIKNAYQTKAKITNFRMNFQTSLNVNGFKILANDLPNNLLKIVMEYASVLSTNIDQFDADQLAAISIECSLPKKGKLAATAGATVNASYKVFWKRHDKSIYVNPMEVIDLRMPNKEALIFDSLSLLDHRRLPDFFFTFHYAKLTDESGLRNLEIYCSDQKNRYLKVKYESPCGTRILESGKRIHKDVDPIRVMVLGNDDIKIYSWIGKFRREEAARAFRKGLELVKKGDFKAGADAFRKAVEHDSRDYESWFNCGLALEKAKDLKGAIEALNKAIEAKGDYAKAHYELGNVLIKTGDVVDATHHLERAIEINPKYGLAHCRLGCILKSQGKYDEARQHMSIAIKFESDAEKREMYKACLDELLISKSP